MHEESIDLSEGVRRIARWSFKLKIDKLTSEQEGRLLSSSKGGRKSFCAPIPPIHPALKRPFGISTAVLACGRPQRS